jgi:sugar lactone lactonase YvrE
MEKTMKKLITFFIILLLSSKLFSQAPNTLIIEEYATVDSPVGNIAFTPDNRMIFSYHPLFGNKIRVAEYKNGSINPFPNIAWNTESKNLNTYLDNVLGIRSDSTGIIWILDTAGRTHNKPKLVAWDTKKDKLYKIIDISKSSHSQSFLNDFAIDEKRGYIIIADEGIGGDGFGEKAGFIVVNIKTGKSFRILDSHSTTLPENIPTKVNGKTLMKNGKVLTVGNDGITIDKNFEWLYYSPLSGTKIYRLPVEKLINSRSNKDIEPFIETFGKKANNGGLSIDEEGNLYTTEIETKSIGVLTKDGKYLTKLGYHNNMYWPDGVSYSPDGYMYISAAQVHLSEAFNGKEALVKPFKIFRFKPIVKGLQGR